LAGYSQGGLSERAVVVSATAETNLNQIIIEWIPYENTVTDMQIFRRHGEDVFSSNGSPQPYGEVELPGTTFIDTEAEPGEIYEYIIWDNPPLGYGPERSGYLTSGIEVDESSDRGILILLYDTTYLIHFLSEFNMFKQDLIGDGYRVKEIPVDRNDNVPYIKELIVQTYNEDTVNTNTLFIFGHVPVPYSGSQWLDGHTDHHGAWPADTYYADINGIWTDSTVNSTNSTYSWCTNHPGDGKFDQNTIPSLVELAMGRVDFHALPVFQESEEELLRLYLIKDHQYRHGIITQPKRALIDDQMGWGNSSNAWINMATLVDPDSVYEEAYLSMSDDGYLISSAFGFGTWWSMSGVLNHYDYALNDIQSIFTFSFGSYFGDWDSWDGLLRCALGSGTVLTNVWTGRPGWKYNSMSMGKTIGYCAKRSMNARSFTAYENMMYNRNRAMALMGDPTLRIHILAPPAELIATGFGNEVELVWQASNDNVLGYDIYRKGNGTEHYARINQEPVEQLSYIDLSLSQAGEYMYMVRAVRLETSQTGTYYNRSQGIFDTTNVNVGLAPEVSNSSILLEAYPNPTRDQLNVRFRLPNANKVKIDVLDQLGRIKLSILETATTQGHSVALPLEGIANGVYTLKIITGSAVESNRFVISR
jgi:hypothetical protein